MHDSVMADQLAAPHDQVRKKWGEMGAALDRLAQRVGDLDEFDVMSGSSLAGDDAASHPFEVSQAVRHLINASVDQLHGAKVLIHDAGAEHLAVASTLARAALENTAAAMWILGPRTRDDRVARVLRWHARNYHDEAGTVGHLVGDAPQRNLELVKDVAARRGLDGEALAKGYKVTTPIDGSEEFTTIQVRFLWSLASGFAHGRPWAYQGLLEQETLRVDGHGGSVRRLSPRQDLNIWLPLEAMHFLSELLRLRDRRAGLAMPPMPDGSPDHETLR